MAETERVLKGASGNLYSPDSESCTLALEQLRDLLLDIGFKVNKRSAGEATLRVYPPPARYPLLNPRFRPGLAQGEKFRDTECLGIAVLSRTDDAGIERQLSAFTPTPACAFVPYPFVEDKNYRLYGVFVLPLRFLGTPGKQEIDFASMKAPLAQILQFLQSAAPATVGAIPPITAEDVRGALRDLDQGVSHLFGESTGYDLLEGGKRYPPKAVVGLACRRLLGRALGPYDFKGGLESKCFKVLRDLGFKVVPKPTPTSESVWALCANPSRYRIEQAVKDLVTDWWTTAGRKIQRGDRLVIWKTAGKDGHRGIVAFGEVVGDPELRTDSDNPFWMDPSEGRARAERVPVRYTLTPKLPAYLGGSLDTLLGSLSVAKAKGGTVFRVSPEDWGRLISALGPIPVAGSATEVDPPEGPSAGLRQGGSRGQGRGLNAEETKLVEQHAMEAAIKHYEAEGWDVTDVSSRLCYDLRCRKAAAELHIEVKGTTSEGSSVLVTRGEVNHIRACDHHVLFVVSGIRLERRSGKAPRVSGGRPAICEPLRISEHRLEPVSFELFL